MGSDPTLFDDWPDAVQVIEQTPVENREDRLRQYVARWVRRDKQQEAVIELAQLVDAVARTVETPQVDHSRIGYAQGDGAHGHPE